MDKLKVLSLFLISVNLIFAEEVKSDSLHWNTNSMKRQKLFYSSEDNLKFPPNEQCVGLGCCLIPLTGCIMIGQDVFVKDTTKKDTTQVSKSKWGFGIGYSGGVCYTGKDLVRAMKPGEEFSADFTRWLYWLNQAETNILYWVNLNQGIGIKFAYMWTEVTDRVLWTSTSNEHIETDIASYPISFFYNYKSNGKGIVSTISVNYYPVRIYVLEAAKYTGEQQQLFYATISAQGVGISYTFNWQRGFSKKFNYFLGLSGKYGFAKEYAAEYTPIGTERSPFHYPVTISFSGIYVAIDIRYEL